MEQNYHPILIKLVHFLLGHPKSHHDAIYFCSGIGSCRDTCPLSACLISSHSKRLLQLKELAAPTYISYTVIYARNNHFQNENYASSIPVFLKKMEHYFLFCTWLTMSLHRILFCFLNSNNWHRNLLLHVTLQHRCSPGSLTINPLLVTCWMWSPTSVLHTTLSPSFIPCQMHAMLPFPYLDNLQILTALQALKLPHCGRQCVVWWGTCYVVLEESNM